MLLTSNEPTDIIDSPTKCFIREWYTSRMSLDTLLETGEKIYLKKYKNTLERESLGSYAVIDVESEECIINENKLKAFEIAQKTFGQEKLFFVVQVGELNESHVNFKENASSLSWAL